MPHHARITADHHPTPERLAILVPALVILLALLLRIAMLGIDVRLHPDEALFAAQSRLILTHDDWLLRDTDLDKPPLTFYVTALAFRVLPVSEFAARLPSVFFSGLSVALLYTLSRTLYRDHLTALAAALLYALSPYALAFAATTFTDGQATFWVLVACVLAVRDRWTAAGAAAALMFAAKPTALLFLPLILALGITQTARMNWRGTDFRRRLVAFGWPLLLGIALLATWDAARAPRSFFTLGTTRNQPGRLIRAEELWSRARQWTHWLHAATGSRALNLAALGFVPLGLLQTLRRPTRANASDWLVVGYAIAFMGWYWLVAFNTYDRYIHTLVPFLLLLITRGLIGWLRSLTARRWLAVAALALASSTMLPATITTLRGDAALGGDQGRHTGIDALARYLNTDLARTPEAQDAQADTPPVVYDYWLGWELAYYLGPTPQVTVHYVPLPDALASAMQHATTPRYFVAPSPTDAALWLAALDHAAITAVPVYHDSRNGFIVYRLTAP